MIELLVVMAIIGVLSGVVLQNIASARIKSRDTARISTIDQINKAIELSATGGTYKLPATTGYVCLGMTVNTSPNSCSPLPDDPIDTTVSDTVASNLANKAIPRDPKFQEGIGTAYLYNSNLTPPAEITTGVGAYLSWVAEGNAASSCGRGQIMPTRTTNGWQCFLRIGNPVTN